MSNYSISNDDDYMTNVSLASTNASDSNGQPGAPHTRILSFAAAPPSASSHNPHATSHLSLSRQYTKTGAAGKGSAAGTSAAAAGKSSRKFPQTPDRVLDAPGFMDDYYLNLISWSCTNKVAIALVDTVYIWNAETGDVTGLHTST
jgi:cell division cycle protein 20 (cofactor of APC complex)